MRARLMRVPSSLYVVCLGASLVHAACTAPAPAAPPAPPPAPPKRALPVDFVVVVDDSGSISPAEQAVLRETTMLLADLADEGDRVSAIAFGEGARKVATATISGDADRRAFKDAVRTTVRFKENWSDIRAGLKLLAKPSEAWFRPAGQSQRVAVVLSDGRLEPRDKAAGQALAEIGDLLRGPLANVDLYAVVLGDKSSKLPIPGLRDPPDGLSLMRTSLARTDDRFFHAQRIDQLLDVTMSILARTKGSGPLAEPGKPQIRVDDTVELLTLVVRKRATDGTQLARSSDIQLRVPGREQPLTSATASSVGNMYWSADYEYFDLVQLRRPKAGLCEVALGNGTSPQILARVRTPISLRFAPRPFAGGRRYFSNELAVLPVWLFDANTGAVSRDPSGERYRVQAKMGGPGALNRFVPVAYDHGSGQYLLYLPDQIGRDVKNATVEFVAEKRNTPGSDQMDPWFIRRSSPFAIEIAEPFVSWRQLPDLLSTVPLPGISSLVEAWGASVAWLPRHFGVKPSLGAEPVPSAKGAPTFEVPPTIEVETEVAENGAWKLLAKHSATMADRVDFPVTFPGAGHYRYRYRLAGTTPEGPFEMEGLWHAVSVRRGWEFLILAILLLLGCAQWYCSVTARLNGRISGATFSPVSISGRVFDPTCTKTIKALLDQNHVRFRLAASSLLCLRKRVVLIVTEGLVTVLGPRRGQTATVGPMGKKPGRLLLLPGAPVTVKIGAEEIKLTASL
jgi:von Willebrand factor type A domain